MRFSATRSEFFPLSGGLDLITPPVVLQPGSVVAGINYEVSYRGGYERIGGFERFDGRPKPSDARFTTLTFPSALPSSLAVGDSINGQTSGATAVVTYIAVDRTFLCCTKVTGTFQVGENIREGATVVGVFQALTPSETIDINKQFALAADVYRADIQAVPGAGPIRGVQRYNGTVYAFRNDATNTKCVMWKSSSTGWQEVQFFEELAFTAGSGSVDDGDTITQGAVTATVRRVVIRTGTLASGNAQGILVISGRTGGNFSAGAASTTGGGTLTVSGAQTQITLAPGGRFEFVLYNFTGSSANLRMYGCDGVNRAFEFDGTVFAPIPTGMSPDAPKFITAHKKHLFLSFGASVQHSAPGQPFVWSPVLGAAEIATGEDVSGFQVVIGNAADASLMIFTRNKTLTLYGNNSADWNLIETSPDTGAIPYTVQNVFYPIYLDDIGVTVAPATQAFGNFEAASISDKVRPFLIEQAQKAIASVVARHKNQYRLYFDDGTGLTFSFVNKKLAGIMPFRLTKVVRCISESEEDNVSIYFGSDDGYVYQADRGRSFDGTPIDSFIQLAFNHSKNPRGRKRYRSAVIEINGESSGDLDVSGIFSYGTSGTAQTSIIDLVFSSSGSKWGIDQWGQCKWGGQGRFSVPLDVVGTGFNLSLRFSSNTAIELPHTITGVILQYIPGREERG